MTQSGRQTTASDALRERASMLLDLGRAEEALELLEQAAAIDPEESETQCLLAATYRALGRHVLALRAAEAACAGNPRSEWAHRLRSYTLLELGEGPEALRAAEAAVREAPNLWEPLAALAGAQLSNGMESEALETAYRARDAAPAEPQAHALVGWIAMNGNDPAQAEAPLRDAIRLDPNTAGPFHNLALTLERTGRKDEAITTLAEAVRVQPGSAKLRTALRDRLMQRLQPDAWRAAPAFLVTFGVMGLLRGSWPIIAAFILLPPLLAAGVSTLLRRHLLQRAPLDSAALQIVAGELRFQWESSVLVVQALLMMLVIMLDRVLPFGPWSRYLPPLFCLEALVGVVIWARRGIRFGRVPGQQGP